MISNDCLHNYLTSRIFVCSRRSRGSQLNVVFLDRIILRVSTMFQKVGRAETCTHINVKLCILQTCPLWVKPKDPNQDCVSVNMYNDNIVHRVPCPLSTDCPPPPAVLGLWQAPRVQLGVSFLNRSPQVPKEQRLRCGPRALVDRKGKPRVRVINASNVARGGWIFDEPLPKGQINPHTWTVNSKRNGGLFTTKWSRSAFIYLFLSVYCLQLNLVS